MNNYEINKEIVDHLVSFLNSFYARYKREKAIKRITCTTCNNTYLSYVEILDRQAMTQKYSNTYTALKSILKNTNTAYFCIFPESFCSKCAKHENNQINKKLSTIDPSIVLQIVLNIKDK